MTTEILEKEIHENTVLIVDSAMQVNGTVEWTDAVTLLMTNKAYTLIPRSDGSLIRSQKVNIPRPLVVCLNRYVGRVSGPQKKYVTNETDVAKNIIHKRDNYTCQYCGEYGDTIDHVFPKSRGGKNTWGNLVTACSDCNGRKKDKTPEEAGMKQPKIANFYIDSQPRRERLQEALIKVLSEAYV